MSISSISVTPREKTKSTGVGAVFGIAGMTAYYLPVTKDRFVRNAFSIVRNEAEDNIEMLNDTALAISKNKISAEQRLFLDQLGVAENVGAINSKIDSLKHSITDSTAVKNLKQGFANSFADCKKSEVMRDAISSKAFSKIRWTNFGWGAAIGFVIGSVLGFHIPQPTHKLTEEDL